MLHVSIFIDRPCLREADRLVNSRTELRTDAVLFPAYLGFDEAACALDLILGMILASSHIWASHSACHDTPLVFLTTQRRLQGVTGRLGSNARKHDLLMLRYHENQSTTC